MSDRKRERERGISRDEDLPSGLFRGTRYPHPYFSLRRGAGGTCLRTMSGGGGAPVSQHARLHTHTERRCIVDTLYNTRPRSANFPKRIPQSQNFRCRPPHSAAVSAARQPCRVCRWRMGETIDLFSFAPVLCRQRERETQHHPHHFACTKMVVSERCFFFLETLCVCKEATVYITHQETRFWAS